MYTEYSQVPWYRRSSLISVVTLLGLCFGPAILAVCILVLTGDVYYDKKDSSGQLKTWGAGNKVAAVVILGVQIVATWYMISQSGNQPGALPR